MFKSLDKFIAALNRSDEFDGEHFDDVSQTKSEKDRIEKQKKISEDKQQNNNKTEMDVNELIELRLAKYKDFSLLKKPNCRRPTRFRSESDLPSYDSSFM